MKTSAHHLENLWEIRTKPDGNGKTIEKPRGSNEKTMWAPLENRWKTHEINKLNHRNTSVKNTGLKALGNSEKSGGISG